MAHAGQLWLIPLGIIFVWRYWDECQSAADRFLWGAGAGLRSRQSFPLLTLLIGCAVLLVLIAAVGSEPEVRVLLAFIDSYGVDLLLSLFALQFRHYLMIAVVLLVIPTLKLAYRFGAIPDFWPYKEVMRSSPSITAYAVVQPITFLLVLLLVARWLLLCATVIGKYAIGVVQS